MKRELWVDKLKILAMIFVVVLHVGEYIFQTFGASEMSSSVSLCWNVVEAFAYCSIHLFVMSGAYLMMKSEPKPKQYAYIWCQTWIVCLVGLILSILLGLNIDKLDFARSVAPFTFRAYWFVSDYILLMLLSPFLNKLIKILSEKQLIIFTGITFLICCLLPNLPGRIGWRNNYCGVTLFVFLYSLTACINLIEKPRRLLGMGVYVASTCAIVGEHWLSLKTLVGGVCWISTSIHTTALL